MLVDPAGIRVAEATEETETLTVGQVLLGRIHDVRMRVPSLQHRRPEVYAAWLGEDAAHSR